MNQHSQIQSDVVAWIEGTLGVSRREAITHHLGECKECRRYFEIMSAALRPSASEPEMILAADPYLITRVRALAAQHRDRSGIRGGAAIRWTWRTAAFVLAVSLGLYIGESLTYHPSQITDHDVLYEYSNSFWDSGIESRWQTLSQVVGEEKQ